MVIMDNQGNQTPDDVNTVSEIAICVLLKYHKQRKTFKIMNS